MNRWLHNLRSRNFLGPAFGVGILAVIILVYEGLGSAKNSYQLAMATMWPYPTKPKSRKDPSLVISKHAVLYCMDSRFAPLAEEWIKKTLPTEAFHLSHAGAWRAVLDEVSRPGVLQEIEKFVHLGGETLHGMCHFECAAYDGVSVPEEEAEAKAFYAAQGERAAHIIQERFPSLTVEVYVMTFEGIQLVKTCPSRNAREHHARHLAPALVAGRQ